MSENGAEQPRQPRATARATVYIDVALADGQKFIFDVDTATELQSELALAIAGINPPEIVVGKLPEDQQNLEP